MTDTPFPVGKDGTNKDKVQPAAKRYGVTKKVRLKHLADLRGVMDQLFMVNSLHVFNEVVAKTSEGKIFHDEAKIPTT